MAGYGIRLALVTGAALAAAACASYPTEPRFSTRADAATASPVASQLPVQNSGPTADPSSGTSQQAPVESPMPSTAPIGRIEGGALPSTSATGSQSGPAALSSAPSPGGPGSIYIIQPGDTLSGVGRRFRTSIQALIDLNELGPRGTIRSGQSILLPPTAVDIGSDPFATGPAPVASASSEAPSTASPPVTQPPPRPAPVSPPAATVPAPLAALPRPPGNTAPVAGSPGFQWPVRGDILRRFGPVGLGERNNGINIGASAGTAVVAAAAGRVAYVGDALPGQGLTVLIMHRDGWRTVYGHLGSATVDDGDDVRAGQQVGTVGLTAGDGRPSVHFETRRMQGDNPMPIDPISVLPR